MSSSKQNSAEKWFLTAALTERGFEEVSEAGAEKYTPARSVELRHVTTATGRWAVIITPGNKLFLLCPSGMTVSFGAGLNHAPSVRISDTNIFLSEIIKDPEFTRYLWNLIEKRRLCDKEREHNYLTDVPLILDGEEVDVTGEDPDRISD